MAPTDIYSRSNIRAYITYIVEGGTRDHDFEVRAGIKEEDFARRKAARSGAICPDCGGPMPRAYARRHYHCDNCTAITEGYGE